MPRQSLRLTKSESYLHRQNKLLPTITEEEEPDLMESLMQEVMDGIKTWTVPHWSNDIVANHSNPLCLDLYLLNIDFSKLFYH
jgi:hypothetical protein